MKKIPLNKKHLELPESWDELTSKQRIYAFKWLRYVFTGKISPVVFRLKMLGYITKYKPNSNFCSHIRFYFKSFFGFIYYRIRLGSRAKLFFPIWKEKQKEYIRNQNTISENLFRLSELIDFAFSFDKELNISWKKSFFSNPFPSLKLGNKRYEGRQFILGVAPFTNITAQEFSDCFDLYSGYLQIASDVSDQAKHELQENVINKIIAILYPAYDDHNKNLVSRHVDEIAHLNPAIKFGIFYWFSGIVDFYITHPDYSILFKSNKDESASQDKVMLGMGGIVLMLGKKGYDLSGNVNSFFDAQLQVLQDQINEALGKGISKEQLSTQIGLSLTDINRLI